MGSGMTKQQHLRLKIHANAHSQRISHSGHLKLSPKVHKHSHRLLILRFSNSAEEITFLQEAVSKNCVMGKFTQVIH